MTRSLARNVLSVGLGTAAMLVFSWGLSGCGGAATESGDAVVVTEPGSSPPAAGAPAAGSPAPAASPAPASPTPAATPAPAPATKAEGWGTLKGTIVFGGTPPSPGVLQEKGKADKDPQVCAKDASILSERLVVDGATKGVKNVLVYLPKPTAVNEEAKSAASKADVVFDQVKCIFEPHVLGVMAGAKVVLKSSDPVNHNVNAKLQRNSPFNSVIAGGQTSDFVATSGERGPVPVTCDIHNWMLAYWLVLDNPYFAVTDDKGNFEIKNVPAGTQKVVVWQESTAFVTPATGEDVTVKANEATTKDFTIDPAKVKPAK